MKQKKSNLSTTKSLLNFTLQPEDHVALKMAAAREGKPMGDILRMLVKNWLKNRREQINAA